MWRRWYKNHLLNMNIFAHITYIVTMASSSTVPLVKKIDFTIENNSDRSMTPSPKIDKQQKCIISQSKQSQYRIPFRSYALNAKSNRLSRVSLLINTNTLAHNHQKDSGIRYVKMWRSIMRAVKNYCKSVKTQTEQKAYDVNAAQPVANSRKSVNHNNLKNMKRMKVQFPKMHALN